jgi:hypothetical protein
LSPSVTSALAMPPSAPHRSAPDPPVITVHSAPTPTPAITPTTSACWAMKFIAPVPTALALFLVRHQKLAWHSFCLRARSASAFCCLLASSTRRSVSFCCLISFTYLRLSSMPLSIWALVTPSSAVVVPS